MTQNLKSGQCPICGSNEIYTDKGTLKRGERMLFVISNWKALYIDSYICINCGHFEEYIADKDFNESAKQKIRDQWKRV